MKTLSKEFRLADSTVSNVRSDIRKVLEEIQKQRGIEERDAPGGKTAPSEPPGENRGERRAESRSESRAERNGEKVNNIGEKVRKGDESGAIVVNDTRDLFKKEEKPTSPESSSHHPSPDSPDSAR